MPQPLLNDNRLRLVEYVGKGLSQRAATMQSVTFAHSSQHKNVQTTSPQQDKASNDRPMLQLQHLTKIQYDRETKAKSQSSQRYYNHSC